MARLSFPQRSKDYLDYTLTLPPKPSDTLVVYLHGFASDQQGEKVTYLRDRFVEAGFAFLAFDHRGHGKSSGTMKELTITRNQEDLELILKTEGTKFRRRILVGSSMGGQAAAWYAARHPKEIAANILIAPGFRFIERRLKELGPGGLKKLRKEGSVTYKNQWIEATVGTALFDDIEQYDAKKLPAIYKTPTLIIHGTEDDSVPFEDSVEFVNRCKARPLELLLIAGGDHRLTEQKETLFSAMEEFLRRMELLG